MAAADGVRVDADEFARVLSAAKEFDGRGRNSLYRRTINELKAGGEDAAKAVRKELDKPGKTTAANPSRSRPDGTPLRATIAGNVKVTVSQSKSKPGVVVKTNGKGLSDKRRSLVRAWGKATGWRHPVFMRTGGGGRLSQAIARAGTAWVVQKGRPGFFSKTLEEQRPQLLRNMERAIEQAAAAVPREIQGK